jgi:hypothetical protein
VAVDRQRDVLVGMPQAIRHPAMGTPLLSSVLVWEWRREWRLTPANPAFRSASTTRAPTRSGEKYSPFGWQNIRWFSR